MRRAFAVSIAVVALLALSGCGVVRGVGNAVTSPFGGGGGTGLRGAQTEVGGLRFRTRVSTTTSDGRGFVATTSGAGRSLEGAVAAGQTQSHAYCLRRFGNSDLVWTRGPDSLAGASPIGRSGPIALSGTCVAR